MAEEIEMHDFGHNDDIDDNEDYHEETNIDDDIDDDVDFPNILPGDSLDPTDP